MELLASEFKRRFAFSMYKDLKLRLGEMTFTKDFVTDDRGDMYPILQKSDDCTERVENNLYTVEKGSVKRLFCQFFPFATYELRAHTDGGEVGIGFRLPDTEAVISICGGEVKFSCDEQLQSRELPDFVSSEFTLVISCRLGAFDVYFKLNGKPEFLCTFYAESFRESNLYSSFSNGYAYLSASGPVIVKAVLSYLDNGVSIADIRPIKYENGEAVYQEGRVYLTASVRMQQGAFQGVFSWVPGTAEFSMSGAVFYDCGDEKWHNYLASVIIYDRNQKRWLVWLSTFEQAHILARASFEGDPRFGINIVDVKIMDKATPDQDITAFAGFRGDEDPDLIYDETRGKWLLAVCRMDPSIHHYSYVFFESDEPLNGFKYIGKGVEGSETGGSFVKAEGELLFVCGNGGGATSDYRIYGKDGMHTARFNYPDGGFRGWGTVIPLTLGSRKRYFWLTFDRHNASEYNWSYGNIYCFEL